MSKKATDIITELGDRNAPNHRVIAFYPSGAEVDREQARIAIADYRREHGIADAEGSA